MLQTDGRVPNARIARAIGVSEPTVRKRTERLIQDEIIKVTAVVNPYKTGYGANVLIGLDTHPSQTFEVGRRLAELEQVLYLAYTSGRHDILAEVLLRDSEALLEFHRTELANIEGIVSTETSHVLRSTRVDYEWNPSTESTDQVTSTSPADLN